MHKKAALFALGFIILFNLFLYQTALGIGTFFFFLFLNLYWYTTRHPQSPNRKWGITHAVISTVAAALYAFRDNEVIQLLNLALATGSSALAVYLFRTTHTFTFSLTEVILSPFHSALASFDTVRNLIQNKDAITAEGRTIANIIRGSFIAAVIVGLLTILLYSADPIFARYIREFLDSFTGRAVASLLLFTGLYISGTSLITYIRSPQGDQSHLHHKAIELYIINASVALLLATFTYIQLRYLFIAITPEDFSRLGIQAITYSDYVRRGFFELLIASGIVCAVMLYTLTYLYHLTAKGTRFNRMLLTIISIETLALIISAGKRVYEYALANGLTRTRIVGIVVLIMLTVYLAIILIKTYKNLQLKRIYLAHLAIVVLGILTLNLINIDALSAKTFRPTINYEVDYYYISLLSTDAHTAWPDVINHAQQVADEAIKLEKLDTNAYRKVYWAKTALHNVESQSNLLNYIYGDYNEAKLKFNGSEDDLYNLRKWPSYNLSQYQAYIYVLQNKETFDKISVLNTAFQTIEQKPKSINNSEIYYDRVKDPLFL